ncbi:MAG: enoyl-CoA hydratase/isomerase family protein, partial [Thermoplasmata archaeon]|nr:enoyl-CoA hydratase/isomerase family protein [Thermoplasmata archaeon]
MKYETLNMEVKDGVGTIWVNRPDALNALNSKVLEELECAFYEMEKDDNVGIVVLTGTGEKAFVAGADIKEMLDKTPLQMREFTLRGHRVMGKIENLNKPVIAAINGFALGGGCELAIACDIRIASEKAKIGVPEVNLGIFPGFGGTQRLPRLVGRGKACELIFTGDMVDANEALRIGLVNRVVPPDGLLDEAYALAKKILGKGPIAVKLAKSSINRSQEGGLSNGLAYEIEAAALVFSA